MAEGDTWVNALLGAVVDLVVASILPFAPVVGGAVAGYLEGGSRRDGVRVGAVMGVFAVVPVITFFLVFGGLLDVAVRVPTIVGGITGTVLLWLPGKGVWAFPFLLFAGPLVVVGLGAVGGWMGNYVKDDTGVGP